MKKNILEIAKRLLPHLVLILSVVFIVFVILSRYNPTMAFLSNDISTGMLFVFCILAFGESVLCIYNNRRDE